MIKNSYLDEADKKYIVYNPREFRSQRDFSEVIESIRFNKNQLGIEKEIRWLTFKGFLLSVVSGFCLMAIGALLLLSLTQWFVLLPVSVGTVAFVSLFSVIDKVSILARQQDRRFFLECLRSAESVIELNDAGLFGYQDESDCSNKAVQQVDKLKLALRVDSGFLTYLDK